jgi:hypothetical protein
MKKICELFDRVSMVTNGFIAFVVCLFVIALGLALAFGLLCLKGWLIMLLWNWVMVSVFSLPAINLWVAVGISLLVSLLSKSFKITIGE